MMEEQFPTWADRIDYWHVDDLDCAPSDETLAHRQFCVEELVGPLAAKEQKIKRQRLEHARKVAVIYEGPVGSAGFCNFLLPKK